MRKFVLLAILRTWTERETERIVTYTDAQRNEEEKDNGKIKRGKKEIEKMRWFGKERMRMGEKKT